MATAKKTTKTVSKTSKPAPTRMASADMKPIKAAFNRTSLIAHLAGLAAVETKAAKALMVALEATILASVHKKGLGSFTLPGLLKVHVVNVPAKKKRRGIDPFTKVEREFAAKPATVKIKTRALKGSRTRRCDAAASKREDLLLGGRAANVVAVLLANCVPRRQCYQ